MDKATQFVESFQKTLDVMKNNIPKGMSFAVIIYARDTEAKTKEYPDGITKTMVLQRVTPYDRCMIRQFVDESFVRRESPFSQ